MAISKGLLMFDVVIASDARVVGVKEKSKPGENV
jgi:hypothetical protein